VKPIKNPAALITMAMALFLLSGCAAFRNPDTVHEPYEAGYSSASYGQTETNNNDNIAIETTATKETADAPHPHADLLHSIMSDVDLLAQIEAVIGAPLHFCEDSFLGLPFITVLPSRNVVISGRTDWAQTLTVFLRPDHTASNSHWIFEAYDITGDGIVLVEPFISRGAEQTISDSETLTMRIYYEGHGNGMHGAWDDGFNFAERELGENWAKDAMQYIREIADIVIRDIWFEEDVLHIMQSPIEDFIAWGPASYRGTLLYLTGASLPGVEYVFITGVEPGPFRYNEWAELEEYRGFVYTGRKVLRGHHWAWVGPGVAEKADEVLEFFEQQLYAELSAMAKYIDYASGSEARLYYLYVGLTRGIGGIFSGGIHHGERMFYRIMYGELWMDANGDYVGRVPQGWFYICEDFSEIFWVSANDYEIVLTFDEWRDSEFYSNS